MIFKNNGGIDQSEYLTNDYEIADCEFKAWEHNYKGEFQSITMFCNGEVIQIIEDNK
jgi:hypothetical protein